MRIELLLFLSFMVMIIVMVACSLPRKPSSAWTPTLFPALTLTPYQPRPLAPFGADVAVPMTIAPPQARDFEVRISPPRCYDTASPMLTCLGALRNMGARAIGDVVLLARFSSLAGEPRGRQRVVLEQRRLDAGESAPYRLLAPRPRQEPHAIEIALVDAREKAQSAVSLSLLDERSRYLAAQNRYHFAAAVKNESQQPARDIRLIVSLENAAGDLVGYRVADLAAELRTGDRREIAMWVAPLGDAAPFRHRAWLGARR